MEGSARTPVNQHPLLAMIAECDADGRPLQALQTLRSAADEVEVAEAATAVPRDPQMTTEATVTFREETPTPADGGGDDAQPFTTDDADDTLDGDVGTVSNRQSTPERIRRRTTKLYGEIHELIDRNEIRHERQRDMLRRDSGAYRRQSSIKALEDRRRSSSGSRSGRGARSTSTSSRRQPSTSSTAPQTRLPDLYQEFEESRRRHLAAAQAERSPFPPMAYTAEPPSASDPDSFSLRFQTMSFPSQRSGRKDKN